MDAYYLPTNRTFQYDLTGKFKAPSPEWRHMSRVLDDFELIIMTEGVLHIALDDEPYSLGAGDYLVCAPTVRQEGIRPADCAFYWLHFTVPELARKPASHTLTPKLYRRGNDSILVPVSGSMASADKVIVMMKQLQDAVRSYGDSTYNNFLTTSILLEFANECRMAYGKTVEHSQRQQLYNDIIDFINWNVHTNMKVREVATHFGYNSKYLSHLFNELTGQSLKQYIIMEKIERAKFILTDTNDPILTIASMLGFTDSHNFMKLFKKHVGLTPMEYRNTYCKRLLYYV